MIEILDLRQTSARLMRPLLEEEAQLWQTALDWDYRSSTELLLGYLQNRILPGYVALQEGEPQGFTFSVFEASKAVIGDCFSRSAFRRALGDEGRDPILNRLLSHLLELLRATPGVDRIESQLLLFPARTLRPIFEQHGFSIFPRLFMECHFGGKEHAADLLPPPPAVSALHLRRWLNADFDPAAALIHTAYAGHVDARINDQYRSLHGSLRFLHNIVRFPGCGTFEPTHSWVLERPGTGNLVGLLLCSRIAGSVAHITQLCLAPELQGEGIGTWLLRSGLHHLRSAGYVSTSLTVTAENEHAVALYGKAGFKTRREFDAAALDLPASRTLLP